MQVKHLDGLLEKGVDFIGGHLLIEQFQEGEISDRVEWQKGKVLDELSVKAG